MKLDRNNNADGHGKYGLILNRRLAAIRNEAPPTLVKTIDSAIALLESQGLIDWGNTVETEFFVMRLRDVFASSALQQYAFMANFFAANRRPQLQDYADDVQELAHRSTAHPNKKWPD